VLVAALLAIGAVTNAAGLFDAIGDRVGSAGSLSAFVWIKAARGAGAAPDGAS
jgi:hypothetical protein